MRRLQLYFGTIHHKRRWADAQIARQTEHATRPRVKKGIRTVSVTFTDEAIRSARARAVRDVDRGKRFPCPPTRGEGELEVLVESLDHLMTSIDRVEDPVLPLPDRAPPTGSASPHSWYSDQAIYVLIERLFAEGIDAYEALVERNFPGLKDRFALYSRLPVVALVDYRREIKGAENLRWGAISYSMVSAGEGRSRVEVHIEPNQPVFRSAPGSQRPQGLVAGDWTDVENFRKTDLQSLLLPHSAPGFRGAKVGSAGSRAPIRAFAYRCIREDLRSISASDLLKELRR